MGDAAASLAVGEGKLSAGGWLSLAQSMNKGCFSDWFGSLAQELQEAEGECAPGISQYLLETWLSSKN